MKRTIIFLMSSAMLISWSVRAEDKEKKDKKQMDLGEVVITATKTKKQVKDISSTVEIITREDIAGSDSKSCMDVLNSLPGVFIHKTGDFGRADIVIRGLGDKGTKVMVLINGMPVKMGLFGCTVTHSLPLNNVERIEVIKGAASVLYGSDALGGVINIITRKPEKGFETDINVSYGSFNVQGYQVQHGANLGDFNYFVSGDYRSSDGHVDHSKFSGKDASATFGYKLNDVVSLDFGGKYFKGYKEEPLRSTDPVSVVANTWNDYERGNIDLTASFDWKEWSAFIKTYTNLGEHLFSDGWHSRDYVYGAVVNACGKIFENNELTVGSDFRKQAGESFGFPIGYWSKNEYAVYVRDEHTLFEKLILSAGARYNIDQISGSIVVPQFSAVYHFSDATAVRTLVNEAFRSPQLTDLYLFPVSNAQLKPERVWNYELGLKQKIIHGMDIDVAGFIMEAVDFIETVKTSATKAGFQFQNTGNYEFKGVEAGLNACLTDNLISKIYYTYFYSGDRTQGKPGNKLDIILKYVQDSLEIVLMGQYVGNYYADNNSRSRIDDYFVSNAKISYKFINNLKAFLAFENIFNKEYSIYADLPSGAGLYAMPKFGLTAGINVQF